MGKGWLWPLEQDGRSQGQGLLLGEPVKGEEQGSLGWPCSAGPHSGAREQPRDALPGRLSLFSCFRAPRAACSLYSAAWAPGSCFPGSLSSSSHPHRSSSASVFGCVLKFLFSYTSSLI